MYCGITYHDGTFKFPDLEISIGNWVVTSGHPPQSIARYKAR